MEFLRVIKSVMAAMIGVQNKKNLKEDFSKRSAMPFIIAGMIMALIFVVTVWAVVQLALRANSG